MASQELTALYEEIHRLTHEACLNCQNEAAKLPHRCCEPLACEHARKWAARKGIILATTDHPELPYMGEHGCTLELTLKPLCTMHSCDNCGGSERYLELKRRIEELEGEDWLIYLADL